MPTNKYKESNTDMIYPLQRISYAKKKANDFAWAEKVADFYDYYYGNYYDSERIKRLKMNYNLYNGRGEDAMKEYYSGYGADLEIEGVEGGFDNVQHHPLIDQIAKAMVGEQQRRPLKPIAIDSSGYTMNLRKMERVRMFQDYINQKFIDPIKMEVIQQTLVELGINDPYNLSPDEQEEFNLMVQERVKAKSPDEIENYMRKDYKSPSETQAQKLLDYMMGELDIKYITDEGFKHGIITGEEIYYVGVRHNNPYVELVNPIGFTSSQARNTHFIEDGEWAKYERYIKYTDLFNEFGDVMRPRDLKKLEGVFNAFGIGGSTREHHMESRLVGEVSAIDSRVDGALFDSGPDIRTKEGQEFMKQIYQHYGTDYDGFSSIRHVHLVWKSLRKLKYIERVTQTGKKGFFVDESYEFNKLKGDLTQKEIWVPEVWECDKFGTTDALYLNKRPVPFQYRSLDDPWNVKLPYVGVEYGRLFGNTKNVSPMDLGKPWQYKFNVQMAKIHEMEATDVGKVLLTTMGAKPKDWSWGKWIMMMKYGKIAPIDTQSETFNPGIDSQIFKQIDLSTLNDLAGRLQYLEFIRNQVALSMSYNPSRLGQVAPYTAVTNSQQNIVQSSYQTEDIYSTHNKVIENLLNVLVKAARLAFRNNEIARTYLLDDMSIAELELDWTILDQSKIGIKIRNSSDDFNNIMNIKSISQAMVQNGLITMPELIKLMWANNGAEILNIAENAEMNAERRRQQEFQNQQQMLQQQSEMQKQLQQLQQEFEREKMNAEHQKDLLVAQINSTRFAQQYDINQNQISDNMEREKMRIEHERIQKERDRALDKEKHKDTIALKEKEIRARKT